jgi:HEAT repeat protein
MRVSFIRILCIVAVCSGARGAVDPGLEQQQINGKLSWVHWWEANRETYLRRVIEARGPATRAADDARGAAAQALVKATFHENREVRAEAVLALARMREAATLPRLRELAKSDAETRVRCRAIVALGLMQDREGLKQIQVKELGEDVALMASLGLVDQANEDDLTAIRGRVRRELPEEVQRMALWALRQHRKAKDRELALKVLRGTPSFVLACEAMMTLAVTGDGADDIASLAEIAAAGANAQKLPCFAANAQFYKPIMHLRAAACLALAQFEGATDPVRAGQPPAPGLNGGIDQSQIQAGNVLSSLVLRYSSDGRGGQSLYPAMAGLALPKYGHSNIAADVINMRWPLFNLRDAPPDVRALRLEPQRATAAIALGIFGGRVPQPGLGVDARNFVPVMATYLSLSEESRFVRAGFVVALGLTGDRENATSMVSTLRQIKMRDNALLWGHLVLGLGLLQDERALEAAAVMLSAETNPRKATMKLELNEKLEPGARLTRMDYTLGKRAAILGLAALGDPRAAPMLRAELYGPDQYVSIEAARAMNWCGVPEPEVLTEVLSKSPNPQAAAMAALLIGEMYDVDRPSKLSRLVAGNYYGVPVYAGNQWFGPADAGIQREFHALGNRFLYLNVLRVVTDWD